MSAGTVLETILNPLTDCLSPEAAEKIVQYKVDSQTQSRVDELAAKAQSGSLTHEETNEYRELIEAFDLVAILKSRARMVLKKT